MNSQYQALAALLIGKNPVPSNRRPGGPQNRPGRFGEVTHLCSESAHFSPQLTPLIHAVLLCLFLRNSCRTFRSICMRFDMNIVPPEIRAGES